MFPLSNKGRWIAMAGAGAMYAEQCDGVWENSKLRVLLESFRVLAGHPSCTDWRPTGLTGVQGRKEVAGSVCPLRKVCCAAKDANFETQLQTGAPNWRDLRRTLQTGGEFKGEEGSNGSKPVLAAVVWFLLTREGGRFGFVTCLFAGHTEPGRSRHIAGAKADICAHSVWWMVLGGRERGGEGLSLPPNTSSTRIFKLVDFPPPTYGTLYFSYFDPSPLPFSTNYFSYFDPSPLPPLQYKILFLLETSPLGILGLAKNVDISV